MAREKAALQRKEEKGEFRQRLSEKDRLRYEDQVRRLQQKNFRDLKKAESQKDLELENLRFTDQRAYESLSNEKQALVREYNRIHGKEIREAQAQADEKIQAHYNHMEDRFRDEEIRNQRLLHEQRRELTSLGMDREEESQALLDQMEDTHSQERERLVSELKMERERLGGRYRSSL